MLVCFCVATAVWIVFSRQWPSLESPSDVSCHFNPSLHHAPPGSAHPPPTQAHMHAWHTHTQACTYAHRTKRVGEEWKRKRNRWITTHACTHVDTRAVEIFENIMKTTISTAQWQHQHKALYLTLGNVLECKTAAAKAQGPHQWQSFCLKLSVRECFWVNVSSIFFSK